MNIGYLAIYLDCDSSNQEVYGNIFYGIKSEIAQNGGTDNRIDGNVFIGDTGIGSTGRGDDGPSNPTRPLRADDGEGSVVRWFGGSVVRWFGGSVVRWFGGSVVRWFGGSGFGSSGVREFGSSAAAP